MRRLKFIKNKKGVDFIAAVVLVITIMIGVVVSSIIFFNFADATETATRLTEGFSVTPDGEYVYFNVSRTIDGTVPDIDVFTNTNGTWVQLPSTSWNRTGQAFTLGMDDRESDTSQRVTFNTRGANEISNVVLYAITVFALLAIIPLIMVGGLMLRSLGFMSGGEVI